MEDAQIKSFWIGVGILATGYLLGRLSSLEDVATARTQGFYMGWDSNESVRKIMEKLKNERTEFESSAASTASGTDCTAGTTDTVHCDRDNGIESGSTGPTDACDSKEVENEVDCFGDASHGIASVSLQEGSKVT